MKKDAPAWLPETREFCRRAGIKITAWGPDMLTVEARSRDRAQEITSQLGQLGFKTIQDEDDANAGILSLSKNPEAVRAKIASFPISRRRWDEQIEPLIWTLGAIGCVISAVHGSGRYPFWFTVSLGIGFCVLFVWDAIRIWGWRLEILPQGLHIRRRYRWKFIQWTEIQAVDSFAAKLPGLPARMRNQEVVVLRLVPHTSERLGMFGTLFARNLRNRLREEVTKNKDHPHSLASGAAL